MKKNMRYRIHKPIVGALLMATLAAILPMKSSADSAVKIHGTLVAASCSADTIDVDFGDVALDTVTSATNSATRRSISTRAATGASNKMFTLTVTCKGEISDGIKYRLDGTATSFNNLALATNMTGLGVIVALIAEGGDNSQLTPQTWYTLSGAGTYNMIAILVRDPSATFSGGDFSATTTLTMQLP